MAVIKESIVKLINYRIVQEEMSSRLYKAMSVWLNIKGYSGASALWAKYACEENEHAQWAYNYLLNLNIQPEVPSLTQPQTAFTSLPNIIALSYKHELDVLKQCQDLASTCQKEGDYMTLELAQRYLREQVDEIEKTTTFLDKLEAYGEDKIALRLLDNEMGEMV